MITDSIVEEIRKYRQENAAKFKYNVRAIAEDARRRERVSGHKVVSGRRKSRKGKSFTHP